jgi:hypothetical protein
LKKPFQIPFDLHGNQLSYNASWMKIEWKDNFEFEDTLKLVDYERGRSSVTFTMVRTDKTTVSFFVSDMVDVIKSEAYKAGSITGRFTFTKKGSNYGCKLIEAKA